jgi:hypothetical protein
VRFKIPSSQPGSFRAPALYLAGLTKGVSPDRVAWSFSRNLATDDPRVAGHVMEACAAQSSRCQKPAYHFVVTFDPKDAEAERIDHDKMREIAEQVIDRMGLGEYQGLVYAHQDTPHPHVHFLFNRVHPETLKAYSRHNDGKHLTEICRDIAKERGLNIPKDHTRIAAREVVDDFDEVARPPAEGEYWQAAKEQRAPDTPFSKSDIQRLRGDLGDAFHNAPTWDDLAEQLRARGLSLMPKGQGLVITDGKRFAKLSDMGKRIRTGALEDRFGERFTDFMARDAKTRGDVHDREHAPPEIPPDATPQMRELIERRHDAKIRAAQDAINPVTALDNADYDYRYWSLIEERYGRARAAVTSADRRTRRMDTLASKADRRATEKEQDFGAGLLAVFRDPKAARQNWEQLVARIGEEQAAALVRQNKLLLGALKGRAPFGFKSEQRKAAEKAFRALMTKRRRFVQAQEKLAFARAQAGEARRLAQLARRDYELLQLSAGKPERVRQILSAKIRARARALDRVTANMIAKSEITEARKDDLMRALKLHRARQKERERDMGRSR